jgi:hypothetical protein
LSWKLALNHHRYRWLLLFVVASACVFILGVKPFFEYIAKKPGISLNDTLLLTLPTYDLSVPIFLLIYSTILASVWIHRWDPRIILVGLSTYCLVTTMRMATIYAFTLEPPRGWIPLLDPFVSVLAYDHYFAKDLFFSGHIATLCCTIYVEPIKLFKSIKIITSLAVAVMLLIQHIHYSIDIAAAPLFTYACYVAVNRFIDFHLEPKTITQNSATTDGKENEK